MAYVELLDDHTVSDNATNDDAGAINTLQTNLVVSNTTAREFLRQIHRNSTLDANRINGLLVEYMPRVLDYHLYLLQTRNKLERPHPQVFVASTVYHLPAGFSAYVAGNPIPEFKVVFSAEFKAFYNDVLIGIIANKLQLLLFGLQNLRDQLNTANITATFAFISLLDEAGIAQLTDFAYGAKVQLIEETVFFTNGQHHPSGNNFNNIPHNIQQSLLNQNRGIVTQFYAANAALQNILMLETWARNNVLQSISAIEIANLPRIANILKRAAIIFRQSDWFSQSANTLRFVLLYGASIPGYEDELEWVRTKLRQVFSSRVTGFLITDKFLNTVLKLPKIPCDIYYSNCLDIIKDENNVDELVKGFNILATGQPLPLLNFTAPTDIDSLPAPNDCFPPDTSTMGIVLALVFMAGLCAYIASSYCRAASFWGKTRGVEKVKVEPADTASSQPLLPNKPSMLRIGFTLP